LYKRPGQFQKYAIKWGLVTIPILRVHLRNSLGVVRRNIARIIHKKQINPYYRKIVGI